MLVRVNIFASIILTIVTGRIKPGDIENLTEDEDDEDYFGEAREATYLRDDFYRKRRSDEEGFYHTLLSRSEPQHVFKRSHGTEDFEHHNAQFITERDWTGSSKISDADRKELESLFSKLNPDDSDEKTDVTRSIPDDDSLSPLDLAAKKYSAWLMTQPATKIAAALTQKAQVDNRLTRLFFDKRGLDKILPNLDPLEKGKKSTIKMPGHKPKHSTIKLTSQNSDAKHLIMAGPKLCSDDSTKCLCTRACYPNLAVTLTPCICDAKTKVNVPAERKAIMNTTDVTNKRVVDHYARSWCARACHPLSVITDNPCKCTKNVESRTTVANSNSLGNVARTSVTGGSVADKLNILSRPASAEAKAKVFPPQAPAAAKAEIVEKPASVTNETLTGDDVKVQSSSNETASPPSEEVADDSVVAKNEVTSAANSVESAPVATSSNTATKSAKPASPNPAEPDKVPATGLFGTTAPIYLNHPSYQGCFKDRKPVRDLPKRFTRFDTTPEACISECKYQNYKFAGVQYGYLCFCGNAFGRYGKVADKDCNSFCNGDGKRKCGAFWHNSVYSVDGKQHDPTDFDYAKVDEEERLFDKLSPPVVKGVKKSSNAKKENHMNMLGVNAATHLMNAAQATLKAAKKLLPGVSKKQKIGKSGRGKRDDNEDDEELMLERENVLASLKAAHQILQKANFDRVRRNSEKQKRSISEDFDPYDPDDGKDLLKAYMSNVDAYNRQVRSVDDEEEDDETGEKDNFQYRRLAEGELDDGQFVDKYEDTERQEENSDERTTRKRSAEKDVLSTAKKEKNKRNVQVVGPEKGNKTLGVKKQLISDATENKPHPTNNSERDKRLAEERSEQEKLMPIEKEKAIQKMEKRSMPEVGKEVGTTHEGSGGVEMKKRSASEMSSAIEPMEQKKVIPVEKEKHIQEMTKRSLLELSKSQESQISTTHDGSDGGEMKKIYIPEKSLTSEPVQQKDVAPIEKEKYIQNPVKRSLQEINKRKGNGESSLNGASGRGEKKKSSIPDIKQIRSTEQLVDGDKHKRAVAPNAHEGSGDGEKKRRWLPEIKLATSQLHAVYEGSDRGEKTRRSLPESNKAVQSQLHGTLEGSGYRGKKSKSSLEQNEASIKKVLSVVEENRSVPGKKNVLSHKKDKAKVAKVTNTSESNAKREIKLSSDSKIPPRDATSHVKIPPQDTSVHAEIPPWDRKRRSLQDQGSVGHRVPLVRNTGHKRKRHARDANNKKIPNKKVNAHKHTRHRRDLTNSDVSDGALKMAARSNDINDIEASLQKLESIEKKDTVSSEENGSESGSGTNEYKDAGSGVESKNFIGNLANSTDAETKHSKRSAEQDNVLGDYNKPKSGGSEADAKLKADVEKGVDSLLNLVVELYKQQKTIKHFENSVRSLRRDILKELNIPTNNKHSATAKVRNAIQKAAKDRLHILTSSIEHKITEFAKNHPESVKQAKLATSMLPKIPLSDKKLAEAKREIRRRSAEFDNIEDGFEEQNQLPPILREHFKRNAEQNSEDLKPAKRSLETDGPDLRPKTRSVETDIDNSIPKDEVNGEITLSRMHRDVSESEEEGLGDDYDKLFK